MIFNKRKHRLPNIQIGDYTYGNPEVLGWHKRESCLTIGKFCSIGHNVTIYMAQEHPLDWVTTFPFPMFRRWFRNRDELRCNLSKGDVVIGNDVMLGDGSTILSGVTIGDGCVIGARAVVAKDIPPYSVVVGNPARVIRKRFDDEIIIGLLHLKWWDWPVEKIKRNLSLLCSSRIIQLLEQEKSTW